MTIKKVEKIINEYKESLKIRLNKSEQILNPKTVDKNSILNQQIRCNKQEVLEIPIDEMMSASLPLYETTANVQFARNKKDSIKIINMTSKCSIDSNKNSKNSRTIDNSFLPFGQEVNLNQKENPFQNIIHNENVSNQNNIRELDENSSLGVFDCYNCKQKFNDLNRLKKHLETYHPSLDEKYKCKICNKEFVKQKELKWHHLNEHDLPEFRSKCVICGKVFSSRYYLKYHLRMHTEEKPYKCHHVNCQKLFSHKPSLNYHLKMSH